MRIYALGALRRFVCRRTILTAAICGAAVFAGLGQAERCAAQQKTQQPSQASSATKHAAVCTTERHDTLVDWFATPDEATRSAARDNKLVYVMQISGNFARIEFT